MNEYTARALGLLGLAFLAGMAIERYVQNQRHREERRDAALNHLGLHVAELLADKYERETPSLTQQPAAA